MLKNQLLDLLKIYDKNLPVKIYTFEPERLWHETDEFELEHDSIYKMENDKYEDILCLDISTIFKKQTVGTLTKLLSQEKCNLDVCLLEYDEHSDAMYQFNYVSHISIEIKDEYILISGIN